MKREILKEKRIAKRCHNSNHLTKASSKRKPFRRIKPKRKIPSPTNPNSSSLKISRFTEPISKIQTETNEIIPNIPFNSGIQDYRDGILSYISDLDNQYHMKLLKGLEGAKKTQITSEMRTILINWLTKVGTRFRVKPQTLGICIQLIDYILIFRGEQINKKNFQLLGVTSLFISCKYNEIYTAQSEKYIEYCDGQYTLNDLFEMEGIILEQIGFNLQLPTIQQFLETMIEEEQIAEEQKLLIKMLTDMVMYSFNILNSFPKMYLAQGIFNISGRMLANGKIIDDGNMNEAKFKKCQMIILNLYRKNTSLKNSSSAGSVSI